MADRNTIVEITVHHVRTGETLDGIAKANNLTWKMLAQFNWGTSEPDKINQHLRDDVGCSRKTKVGENYVFDDTDYPGLVYIPKPFRAEHMATKRTHLIRVRILKPAEPETFIFSI